MHKTSVLILGLGLALPVLAQNQGLSASADNLGGAHWQARFERDRLPLASQAPLQPLLGQTPLAMRLFGDYQLSALRLGSSGGLRLTGGMLINLHPSGPFGSSGDSAGAMAMSGRGYAGVGYASGGARGDWGFSADLGLSGPGFGSTALDRGLLGSSSTDSVLRDYRLQPMIRLGMSMAF